MKKDSNAIPARTETLPHPDARQAQRAGYRGLCWGMLGIAIFSLSVPATRAAVQELDATFVGLGRAVIAGLLAALLQLLRRQPWPTWAQWRRLAIVAAGVVIGFPLLSALALRQLRSADAAVIIGVLPAATAIAAVLRAGERPPPRFWFAAGAGLTAVLLFAAVQGAGAPQGAHLFALLAVTLAALGYAEGGALARTLGSWQVICWALVLTLPLLLPITLYRACTAGLLAHAPAWLAFGYLSVFSMFLGFFAWYRGLALGGVATVSQIQLAQPILTLAWSSALLKEHVTTTVLIAAGAVLACVIATQRFTRRDCRD